MSSAYDITPICRGRLLPDQPPMRGRETFTAARSALGQVRIEGKPDIQEIHVAGDYAFCWNQTVLSDVRIAKEDPAPVSLFAED